MSDQQAPATCPVCGAPIRIIADWQMRWSAAYHCGFVRSLLTGDILAACRLASTVALQQKAENAELRAENAQLRAQIEAAHLQIDTWAVAASRPVLPFGYSVDQRIHSALFPKAPTLQKGVQCPGPGVCFGGPARPSDATDQEVPEGTLYSNTEVATWQQRVGVL